MLQIFPFLAWLAAVMSAVLLFIFWTSGESTSRTLVFLAGWFLLAAACQFLARSAVVSAVGLALQTLLAIVLVLRWQLSG